MPFLPFLAASALAVTFAQLGSMAVQISVLTTLLQLAFIAIMAMALYLLWVRRKAPPRP